LDIFILFGCSHNFLFNIHFIDILFNFIFNGHCIFILTKLHLPPKNYLKWKNFFNYLYIYAKIMGSIFHCMNYAMKIKSKHLQLWKNYLLLSTFFIIQKSVKWKKNMNWIFLWMDVCLNRCVCWPCTQQTQKKLKTKFYKQVNHLKLETKASWN
jgi:hypothetical protein